MGGIFVHYLNLPYSVKGLARHNEDDSYTVLINARYSQEVQKEVFLHEVGHIEDQDFYSEVDAIKLEGKKKKGRTRRLIIWGSITI